MKKGNFKPNPYEGDLYNLLLMLYKDYNQDPYPPDSLSGGSIYYRPDATFEDLEVEVDDA